MVDTDYLEGKSLQELKLIAEELGLEFMKNIGKTKLIAKIVADDLAVEGKPTKVEGVKPDVKETVADMRKRMNKLIRVSISSNDPIYKGRNGVTKQVGNSKVMVGKFIPFDTVWHVQEPILESLKLQKYRTTKFVTDKTTGNKIPVTKFHNSFVIEYLEPLTDKDLKKLASEQASRGSIPTETE